jgi:uncharacterized protein (TIGR03435 family)
MMLQKQHASLAAAMAMTAVAAFGQPAFEVASVKSAGPGGGRFTLTGGPGTPDPGRIVYTNIPLRRVLLEAYDIANSRLSGPDWLDTLRYDITAKIPEGTTKKQFQEMLRNLLAARFQMVVRREVKELPVYSLLPAKGGVKIKPIEPATGDTPAAIHWPRCSRATGGTVSPW